MSNINRITPKECRFALAPSCPRRPLQPSCSPLLRVCVDRARRRAPGTTPLRRLGVMAAMPGLAVPAALTAGGGAVGGAFLLAGLLLAGLLVLARQSRSHSMVAGSLPGPKQLPVLGNLRDLGHPQAHQTVAEWANRFGGLVRCGRAGQNVLGCTSNDCPLKTSSRQGCPPACPAICLPASGLLEPHNCLQHHLPSHNHASLCFAGSSCYTPRY